MQSIFQSKEWEEFKLKTGYQKSYWIDGILVLQKNLPFGHSMLYSPMISQAQLDRIKNSELRIKQFLQKIRVIAKENNSVFYRLEATVSSIELNSYRLILTAFKKAFEEMQPEHTLVLDLTKSEEQLLSGMKQKCRYNIKLAAKNNIEIRKSEEQSDIDKFYELYFSTAKRHHISCRSKSYFNLLLEILGRSGYAQVYTAEAKIEGKIRTLASAIIVYSGETAVYMFGASSDEYKNLMAPHLLHWQIIQDAKAASYLKYDFFGIAPDDNPKHPWAGITRFKTQFGGEQLDLIGSYDLIIQPLKYQLFKLAEKIRR